MEKLNLTQQKDAVTNQKKCTTTQNKHKKLKPGLVASHDIWPGNVDGLIRFQRFINLSLKLACFTAVNPSWATPPKENLCG